MTRARQRPDPGDEPDPREQTVAAPSDSTAAGGEDQYRKGKSPATIYAPRQAGADATARTRRTSPVRQVAPRRCRAVEIQVLPAAVAPISREDYQQAVAAIATMIDRWWGVPSRQRGAAAVKSGGDMPRQRGLGAEPPPIDVYNSGVSSDVQEDPPSSPDRADPR